MKTNFKFLAIIAFIGFFLYSCSSNDDNIDFNADKNPERFENVEVGDTNFEVLQSNRYLHTQFDYVGKSKVKKIYYDIKPISVDEPKTGEMKWEVLNLLIPERYYEGQLNPHIHYHAVFDSSKNTSTKLKPTEGTYSLKITIIEEDKSKSFITKQFKIVKKILKVKIGDDNKIKFGSNKLRTELKYNLGKNTISEIKYEIMFAEWREGQSVAIRDWNAITVVIPESYYVNQSTPHIYYDIDIPEFPLGYDLGLQILVTETGQKEPVTLYFPLDIVNEL